MNVDTLQARMREATRLTLAGQLRQAAAVIQQAMGHTQRDVSDSDHEAAHAGEPVWRTPKDTQPKVLDGLVFEVPARPSLRDKPTDVAGFIAGTHTHAALTRHYKLYVPPGLAGKPLPLVVMLHGCTQDPDDFAAGTAMNERALEQGFFVLYPAQAQDANPSRCWNWFKHNHQQRGQGEPALIADLVLTLIQQYGMDSSRVYIAGLSAGGAMAAIVAQAYPDIFAAAGIHSGLPQGAASNVAEALAVMKSGSPVRGMQGSWTRRPQAPSTPTSAPTSTPTHAHQPIPTIVFHGDQDQTVHPHNGEQVIAGVMGQIKPISTDDLPNPSARGVQVEQGTSIHGRSYTRTVHHGNDGQALAEHWVVHGAGHAWSGGQPKGSYTDARGPDATCEMLRFFFDHMRLAESQR